MAFCKVCVCGEKIVSERRLGFSDYCPSCGRNLVSSPIYNENDPHVEEIMRGNTGLESSNESAADSSPDIGKRNQESSILN